MSATEKMKSLDEIFSHIWMVRTFLKHCEEAEEDDELRDVHRLLYDVMLSLGKPLSENDAEAYLKQVKKKLGKLKKAKNLFVEIQPEISEHTNFKMAVRSLQRSLLQIESVLANDDI